MRGLTAGSEELQERYLAQAVEQSPGYVDARLALWDVQSARGAHDQAVATLKGVPVDDAQAFDAGIRSAASLVQLRRYDEAYASLKVLASVTPSAVVSNLMGIVQLRRRSQRADGPGHLFLPPGRGAGAGRRRLLLQSGLRLLAGQGCDRRRLLAA